MSRLDELKNGSQDIDIDMTAGVDGIDHSQDNTEKQPTRINMNNMNARNSAGGRSRVISSSELKQQLAPKNEIELDESDYIPETSVQNPDAVAKSILQGEGSLLETWKANKIAEYQERMAQFDEEREELIDEGKLDPRDIKDPGFEGYIEPDDDEEEELEEENDEENILSMEKNNAELVLDEDDLLADLEEVEEEIQEEDEELETVPDEEEEIEIEEKVVKKKKVEKKSESEDEEKVHITDEDREFFNTIGNDVDSSRFIKNDDDEEDEKSTKKDDDVINDEDDEEDNDSDDRTEETLKHLKDLITEKIKPSYKKIDISQFTIKTKKASSNIKNITDGQQLKVMKWVLPNQKQCVFMKQFTGLELQTLSENIQEGSITSMNIAYRMIYDHIVSNKPKTFTSWLAVTPDSDIDHYMFCIFIASYKGSNYLPMDCPNDNCPDPTFLTDDIPIMDMVKFKDDDAKNKFMQIYKSEIVYSNSAGYYTTAITPVSDQIAIGFKESTLKDVIDIDSLDERFRTRYRTTIGLMPYIDAIYEINYTNHTLDEIKSNDYENATKTLRTKIRKYAKIIDTLSSDEFGVISAIIQEISSREDMISYIIPSVECPACGRKIDEVSTSATQLVFTRYQLGALVNTTLN